MTIRRKTTTTAVTSLSAGILPPPAASVPVTVMPVKQVMQYRGMNCPGGDTPWGTWPSNGSGPVANTHYKFLSNTAIDNLLLTGANCFRVLFTWEALQPTVFANITTTTGNFGLYAAELYRVVDRFTAAGASVLLDIHGGVDVGFAAYYGAKVGQSYLGKPVEDLLENVWWQLAKKYQANPLVMYGITNEPHDLYAAAWFAYAQKVINGIRRAGGKQTVWTPGSAWSNASTWVKENAPFYNLVDPGNNLGVQLHLYMDPNAGGGTSEIVSPTIGVERVKAATVWARGRGLKLILGEVGLSASNPDGKATWENLRDFLVANRDVWAGFLFWAAGPPSWWGGYRFYCGPGSAQLAMIQSDLL